MQGLGIAHKSCVCSMCSPTRSASASRPPPGLMPRARHCVRRSFSIRGRRKSATCRFNLYEDQLQLDWSVKGSGSVNTMDHRSVNLCERAWHIAGSAKLSCCARRTTEGQNVRSVTDAAIHGRHGQQTMPHLHHGCCCCGWRLGWDAPREGERCLLLRMRSPACTDRCTSQ